VHSAFFRRRSRALFSLTKYPSREAGFCTLSGGRFFQRRKPLAAKSRTRIAVKNVKYVFLTRSKSDGSMEQEDAHSGNSFLAVLFAIVSSRQLLTHAIMRNLLCIFSVKRKGAL
jgi:hypothetical protein